MKRKCLKMPFLASRALLHLAPSQAVYGIYMYLQYPGDV